MSSVILVRKQPAPHEFVAVQRSPQFRAIFPLTSPGIVSIPAAFIAGIVGTYLGAPDNLGELQAEMEVRSLTGVGVESPVEH